ncbi:hypothetical protein NMD70_06630 [Edwardsiella tarda]
MEQEKTLASVTADTSRIQEKLNALLEVLPEHVPNELFSIIFSLLGDVILVDSSPTVSAGGSINIVYALDFDTTAYNEVMAASRAFKINFAHK